MPNINKANRQVCDVDIRILKTKAPYLFFATANVTTAGFSSEDTYATAKGAKKIAFSNPMDANFTIEAQVTPFKLYALMSDGTIETSAEISRKKTIKCDTAGVLTLPDDVVAGTVFVYKTGEFGEKEIQGTADVAAKTFTASVTPDIEIDEEYEVGYFIVKKSGVQKITFNNKKNPQDYIVAMNTVEKDEMGILTPYIIKFYKAKPKKALDLSFSSEGEPATIKIEFSALEDKNGNVVDMIELEDDED